MFITKVLLLFLLWPIVLHESLHALAITLTGHHFTVNIGWMLGINCIDCATASPLTIFIQAAMPYVVAIIIMLAHAVTQRSRLLFWLSNIVFLDLVVCELKRQVHLVLQSQDRIWAANDHFAIKNH